MAFTALAKGALLALLALPQAQAAAPTCGYEGQDPCDSGCFAGHLPEGPIPSSTWYPIGDNYVVAPEGFGKRQTPGKCTRCGNLYEPACAGNNAQPLCFPGMYSSQALIVADDGICVSELTQFGCGTHGKPLCPDNLVDELGTLAVMIAPTDGNPWDIVPTLYERDGCLFSDDNPNLRFVPAPTSWLPAGHDCAKLCVHCGHVGEPACPVKPNCLRRRSLLDPYSFVDGPTFATADGVCEKLECGGDTYAGALPPCEAGEINERIGPNVDRENDGCADPFGIDTNSTCGLKLTYTEANPPVLEEFEKMCVKPREVLLTQAGVKLLTDAGQTAGVAVGECEQCGGKNMLPCSGADFGGCYVNDGYILSESSGLCVESPCGGAGNPAFTESPFGGAGCTSADGNVLEAPVYTEIRSNPVNGITNCLYFHNLNTQGDFPACEQCGWPGRVCTKECIYTVQWTPVGLPFYNVGTYTIRDDLRNMEHCEALPALEAYSGACEKPVELQASGNADAIEIEGGGTIVHVVDEIQDPTFGSGDNPDECQYGLTDVPEVYTDKCPSGGRPNRKYTQCNGQDWAGAQCCFGYSVCVWHNDWFSQCEDANVPSGVIPWHQDCDPGAQEDTCELGSSCVTFAQGRSFCEPDTEQKVAAADVCGGGGGSNGAVAKVGIAFLVIGLCALLAVAGFVFYKRNNGDMPSMPSLPSVPFLSRTWRARDYVSTATDNTNGKTLDVSEVNESQTLPMEDSAADEFIDMRVASERSPMMTASGRSGGGAGAADDESLEAPGFGGGFGGGGGSGIGRGGIGRIKAPAIMRSTSARGPGSKRLDEEDL